MTRSLMLWNVALLCMLVVAVADRANTRDEPIQIAGVYPHLAMMNNEGECGTGAVVPWADRFG